MILGFMSFGFTELLLVGVVALLVFGGNLPDVMRTLGRSYAKFRQSLNEFSRPVREELRQVTSLPPDRPPVPSSDEAPDNNTEEEYPDFYDDDAEQADADKVESEPAAAPTPPPSSIEIDEPPPV